MADARDYHSYRYKLALVRPANLLKRESAFSSCLFRPHVLCTLHTHYSDIGAPRAVYNVFFWNEMANASAWMTLMAALS